MKRPVLGLGAGRYGLARVEEPVDRSAEAPAFLLPHHPPMVLLSGIHEVSAEGCRAWFEVEPTGWYLSAEGRMPAWFGLELMAQAISCTSGHGAREAGREPRIGFLLGTQSYTCAVPSFAPGTVLEVAARLTFHDPAGLGAFECTLHAGGELLSRSTLKVFEQP